MNFQMPSTTSASAAAPAFSFGLTTNAPAAEPAKPAFSFGGGGDAENMIKAPTFGLGTAITDAKQAGATTTATVPTLGGFLTTTSAPAATPLVSTTVVAPISVPTSTTSINLPKSTAASLGANVAPLVTTTTSTVGQTSGGFANLSTATKTTDSAAVANTAHQMTYNQLEEHINKWTLELEEQEKVFTDQATQINAWDKLLIGNNQKILELNDAIQKVKSDQQLLEHELEFIATQHKELEETILPLQTEFSSIPQVDVERSQTYLLVENLDTQLKQMSEDLKEVIDNLNETNKGQETNDPIMQIGKILNAHMASLQWIEDSSNGICNQLDEIGKMHEAQKREALRSAYYN